MADNRTTAPAMGALGNSPATPNPNTLPRGAYLALALACVCMGLWASYITLEYFEHGVKALETDAALQALAVSTAVMFVSAEMAAFGMAAMLTERQLKARRRSLTGFAAALLLLEVFTIVVVQVALTSGADLAQDTLQAQEKDLRARIAQTEADAAANRATAEQQRATAKNAYELHLSAKSRDKATAERAKTGPLYDELTKVQTQKRPTLVGLVGKKTAITYSIARGILISLGGLVFFGAAGALLRAAHGGTLSVDSELLALLTELRDRPSALAAPVAPVQVSYRPAGAVAPTAAPVGLSYGMFGAGALGAMAAPVAHSSPAVPMEAKAPTTPLVSPAGSASETVQTGASVSVQSRNAKSVQSGASDMATTTASVSVQSDAKKSRVKRAVSAKLDTGTDGKAGARFKRVKAGVVAGKIRPSIRGIQSVEGGSQDVVLDYLRQLETEDVIVRHGRGWTLAGQGGAR